MKKAILMFLLCSLTLVAADVTGNWSGTAKMKRDDGSDGADSVYFTLKQQGSTVTGTVGGSIDDQNPIEKGKLEGDQLSFEVPRDSGAVKVLLKLHPDGKTLTGEVVLERDGAKHTVQLEVKRQ